MSVLRQLYASHCYAVFNRRIDAIMPWASVAVRPFCGYRAEQVGSRWQQRCAELAIPAFMRRCASGFEKSGALPAEAERVNCNGLVLEADGRVTLARGFFVRALGEFLVHWLHALAALLLCLRLKPRGGGATLVYGVGIESLVVDGSDARFLTYCRRGPIAPLADAEMLMVQTTCAVASTEPNRVRYHRFPLFAALGWHGLGLVAWLSALWGHVVALVSFAWTAMRCPSMIILGRDAAYHAVAAALNRYDAVRAVVLTNSNYSAQPLWMWALPGRRYRSHMIWYSQNSVPVVYADDPVDAPLPNFRFITVDETWVWTHGFRAFLEKLGCQGSYHVVGPILWYLPDSSMPQSARDAGEIRLAVFDVTPMRDDVGAQRGLIGNYYCTANMIQFIQDIVHARAELARLSGKRVRILLKHKRSYSAAHDPRYIKLIETLSARGETIELVAPDANMFTFMSSCDLTLVIPYSSPAQVAVSCQRPAIYYDPTMAAQPVYEPHPLLTFVAGRDNLVIALSRSLNSRPRDVRLPQQ